MVFTAYLKQRILYYHLQGHHAPTIARLLREESLSASRQGVLLFLKKFEETKSITRTPGSGRPSKATAEIKALVEQQMREDDESTAFQLHRLLIARGFNITLRTVLRCRTSLGWTFRGSAYCQLIQTANKIKRLAWAQEHLHDTFENVAWTDECTVQLESHKRFCCRKQGELPKPKPRYAHVKYACTSHLHT